MMGLLALRPVYQDALYNWATNTCRHIPERLHLARKILSPKPRYAGAIKTFHRLFWAAGHLGVLWGADSHALSAVVGARDLLKFISLCAFFTGCRPIVLRGLYAITGDAQATLELCQKQYYEERQPALILHALYALVALGLRSPKHEREVRSMLRTDPAGLRVTDTPYFAWARKQAFRALDRELVDLSRYEAAGRQYVFKVTRRLPEGAPGRYPAESDVPADVARVMELGVLTPAYSETTALLEMLAVLPLLVEVRPENFYLPASVMKAFYRPWQTEIGMELLRVSHTAWSHNSGIKPVAHTPGPNEPCPCESGKKYKKCCGAPRPPAS